MKAEVAAKRSLIRRFEGQVPAGALTLRTAATPQFRIEGIAAEPGGEAYAEVVLDWGDAVLEGRVLDAGGDPLPGARVGLFWSRSESQVTSRSTRRTITGERGIFRFARLGRGPHRLEIGAPGHALHRQTVPPGTGPIEVRLDRE